MIGAMHSTLSLACQLVVLVAAATTVRVWAQEPKSAASARELAQLLGTLKLDSIAARLPNSTDEFAGALVFPGQLMVVWAKTVAPERMNEKLVKKEFREVYIDLNSASVPESRHFVMDLGADGLKSRPDNRGGPSDTHDVNRSSMRFDGNWREDKMSEADYMKAYAEADAAYAAAAQALIAALKKG
ncbi:MAG: hypothetical protein ACRD2N_15515 [Vicinamibacterales bacterium]